MTMRPREPPARPPVWYNYSQLSSGKEVPHRRTFRTNLAVPTLGQPPQISSPTRKIYPSSWPRARAHAPSPLARCRRLVVSSVRRLPEASCCLCLAARSQRRCLRMVRFRLRTNAVPPLRPCMAELLASGFTELPSSYLPRRGAEVPSSSRYRRDALPPPLIWSCARCRRAHDRSACRQSSLAPPLPRSSNLQKVGGVGRRVAPARSTESTILHDIDKAGAPGAGCGSSGGVFGAPLPATATGADRRSSTGSIAREAGEHGRAKTFRRAVRRALR